MFDRGLIPGSSSAPDRENLVVDGDSLYLHYPVSFGDGVRVRRIQIANAPPAAGGLSLAPGASTTVPIRFSPASAGSYTGTAIFETNAGTVPRNLLGIGAAPAIDVQPSVLEFYNSDRGGLFFATSVFN
jgi:hypothetical protein